MKEKKTKLGRPPIKDKKVGYTFTIEESKKKAVLKISSKKDLDDSFRNKINQIIIND